LRDTHRVNPQTPQPDVPDAASAGATGVDYQAVVRDAGEAMVTYDPAGRVTSWNAASESLLGYRAADVLGRVAPHLASTDPLPHGGRGLVDRRHRDGRDIALLVSVAAWHDRQGGVAGWTEILRALPDTLPAPSGVALTAARSLARALENAEMHLVYQPIVRLRDRQVVSAEALLRWRDPTGDELSPDRFIGDAEREGMVGALGLFVLRSACAQLAAWRRDGQTTLPVSINVSARQFRLPDLSLSFAAALREYQIDPQWLRLEITESAIVDEPDIAAARIAELRALGISIAIDDFGVGYSSLSRLRQYPIDTLKIDHSFVRDIATDHVAREVAGAVIMLAHKLGMTVVAEGVETEAQYDTLVALGCDCGQGFLLGRPLPPNELAALLAAG